MGFSIIICEGESDAILLGYYLKSTRDWQYLVEARRESLPHMTNDIPGTEEFWYICGRKFLLIWAINGNNFELPIQKVLKYNSLIQTTERIFENICIITDNDDARSESVLLRSVSHVCTSNSVGFREQLCCNTWLATLPISYTFSPDPVSLSFFLTIIPDNEQGTLETFLLNCCSMQDPTDRKVINQCNHFIDNIDCLIENPPPPFLPKYLARRGDRPKAKFSVFFSVYSPKRVFCSGNDLLTALPWENYAAFNRFFNEMITRF